MENQGIGETGSTNSLNSIPTIIPNSVEEFTEFEIQKSEDISQEKAGDQLGQDKISSKTNPPFKIEAIEEKNESVGSSSFSEHSISKKEC